MCCSSELLRRSNEKAAVQFRVLEIWMLNLYAIEALTAQLSLVMLS